MNRKECLDAAAEAVLKNRQELYGKPEAQPQPPAIGPQPLGPQRSPLTKSPFAWRR
ncbi:hypothetical protein RCTHUNDERBIRD_53 [Rhodobacter phage RcThunderbird]|nr:hypothetical protein RCTHUNDERBIRD_53 [Rhodobacter phage RcThunderbird]